MALDLSVSNSETTVETEVSNDVEVVVNFQKGAGPSSFFYLGNNKEAKISKSRLAECIKKIEVRSEDKHEDCLSVLLPDAIQRAGEEQGLDLLSLFKALKNKFEETCNESGLSDIKDAAGLATLISLIAPNASPQELGVKFKALCETCFEDAIAHLDDCERRNGRNEQGYIYLRKQDPTKLASRKRKA